MTDVKGEIRLFKLMNEYNSKIAYTYLESTLNNMKAVEKSIKIYNYTRIPIAGIRDLCCFRIELHFPLFFLISSQISFFKALIKYYKSDIGFLPAYIPEINEITLIKIWNYFADNVLGVSSELPLDYLCLKIVKEREQPELSSMNFILRNDTEWKKENDEETVNLIIKYFKFFYWNFSKPGQIMRSTMFYHNINRILSTYTITKTIFIVEDIHGAENIDLGYKKIKLRRASTKQLIYSKEGYVLKEFECYITDEVMRQIGFRDRAIINAVLNTIRIDNFDHKIISMVIETINDQESLLRTLVGFVALERFDLSGNTFIGVAKGFEKEVYGLYEKFNAYFKGSSHLNYGIMFDKCMTYLSPILICKDNMVYFLHPSFVGLFAHINRFDLLKKPLLLVDLINIFHYDRHKARFSQESDNLQKEGINKQKLLNCIDLVNNSMHYSRILKR